jgi:hypothetical protein
MDIDAKIFNEIVSDTIKIYVKMIISHNNKQWIYSTYANMSKHLKIN